VEGVIDRVGEDCMFRFKFTNFGQETLTGFAVKFNKNSYSLTSGSQLIQQVLPGASGESDLKLVPKGQMTDKFNNLIQIAVKTNQTGVIYLQDTIKMSTVLLNEKVTKEEFVVLWKSLPNNSESQSTISINPENGPEQITQKLESNLIFFMAKVAGDNRVSLYFICKFITVESTVSLLAEVVCSPQRKDIIQLSTKTADVKYLQLFESEITRILKE